MQDFGARFLNNQIGRFIQIDPVSLVLPDDEQLRDKTKQTLEEILANPQALNSYSYTVNNPIKFVDSNGEWFDTLIDVGFILYDVGRITSQFISQGKVEKGEWSALGLDAGSALIPGVVGLGTISRVAKGAEKVVEGIKAIDKVEDTAKAVKKVDNFVMLEHVSDTKYSEIMKNGFNTTKDTYFTNLSKVNPNRENHLLSSIKYDIERMDKATDYGKIKIKLPTSKYNYLVKEKLFTNFNDESLANAGKAMEIINKYIIK